LLSQKQLQIEDCSKIVNEIKKDNEKKEEEIKSVKLENENLRLKLEESQKLIETNNQVINFLNQKCNESYAPFKNFSNMLNYNTSNVATGLGNNLSGNIGNNLSGNTIKNSFPESNILTEKYQTNSNSFNEIQTKSNVLSNVNQNYKVEYYLPR
jgi:spindle assembly abnormal protein 6